MTCCRHYKGFCVACRFTFWCSKDLFYSYWHILMAFSLSSYVCVDLFVLIFNRFSILLERIESCSITRISLQSLMKEISIYVCLFYSVLIQTAEFSSLFVFHMLVYTHPLYVLYSRKKIDRGALLSVPFYLQGLLTTKFTLNCTCQCKWAQAHWKIEKIYIFWSH